MALEAILGAALVSLSRQDEGGSSSPRQARWSLDGARDARESFAARGELVRLRSPLDHRCAGVTVTPRDDGQALPDDAAVGRP